MAHWRDLPLTPMQQVLIALRSYETRTFQWVFCNLLGVSVVSPCTRHSRDFKGYLETKRIIPAVIPREPSGVQEKVLWCCPLFTFVVLFLYFSLHFFFFFDWSFSRFHDPWGWLRSRLILLGFLRVKFSSNFLACLCPFAKILMSMPLLSTSKKSLPKSANKSFSCSLKFIVTCFRSHFADWKIV